MEPSRKFWIVTDLDGTLMDHNYDISPAYSTLEWLKEVSIPVIPCTSKTASEVKHFRSQFNLEDPYIVENGAAIYGNKPDSKGEWEIILGRSYSDLRKVLNLISLELEFNLRALNDLSIEEIFTLTGLPYDGINRALDRHWSVPFLNPPDDYLERLSLICERFEVNVFRGNRMSHLLSKNSHKGLAVESLKKYFNSSDITVIALGDSQNDMPLLESADISVVIPGLRGPNDVFTERIKSGDFILADGPHAKGWANAVESIIKYNKHIP